MKTFKCYKTDKVDNSTEVFIISFSFTYFYTFSIVCWSFIFLSFLKHQRDQRKVIISHLAIKLFLILTLMNNCSAVLQSFFFHTPISAYLTFKTLGVVIVCITARHIKCALKTPCRLQCNSVVSY